MSDSPISKSIGHRGQLYIYSRIRLAIKQDKTNEGSLGGKEDSKHELQQS